MMAGPTVDHSDLWTVGSTVGYLDHWMVDGWALPSVVHLADQTVDRLVHLLVDPLVVQSVVQLVANLVVQMDQHSAVHSVVWTAALSAVPWVDSRVVQMVRHLVHQMAV